MRKICGTCEYFQRDTSTCGHLVARNLIAHGKNAINTPPDEYIDAVKKWTPACAFWMQADLHVIPFEYRSDQ